MTQAESRTARQAIGHELRKIRQDTGKRIIDIAATLGRCHGTVSAWERGDTAISLDAYMEFCWAVNADPAATLTAALDTTPER